MGRESIHFDSKLKTVIPPFLIEVLVVRSYISNSQSSGFPLLRSCSFYVTRSRRGRIRKLSTIDIKKVNRLLRSAATALTGACPLYVFIGRCGASNLSLLTSYLTCWTHIGSNIYFLLDFLARGTLIYAPLLYTYRNKVYAQQPLLYIHMRLEESSIHAYLPGHPNKSQ